MKIALWREDIKLFTEFELSAILLDCPSSLGINEVAVYSSGNQFGSQGIFVCPEDNKLFHENGVYRNESSTVCNEFSEWENSEGLQCWTGIVIFELHFEIREDASSKQT